MTIPQTSPLHINNLPSEIIHKIQGELEKVRGIAGIKSVFNLATTCRTMYSHACEFNRLQSIGLRYVTFTKVPFFLAVSLLKSKNNTLLIKAAQERLEDDINNNKIKTSSANFNIILSTKNKSLRETAYNKWAQDINNIDFNQNNLQKIINLTSHSNSKIKSASREKLTDWAKNNQINGLESSLFTLLHEENTSLGDELRNAFKRKLESTTPNAPLKDIQQNLINSPNAFIRDTYINTFCRLINSKAYNLEQPIMYFYHQAGPAAITSAIEKLAAYKICTYTIQGDTYFNQLNMIDSRNTHIRNYAYNTAIDNINQNKIPVETLNSNFLQNITRPDIHKKIERDFIKLIQEGKLGEDNKERYIKCLNNNNANIRKAVAKEYMINFTPEKSANHIFLDNLNYQNTETTKNIASAYITHFKLNQNTIKKLLHHKIKEVRMAAMDVIFDNNNSLHDLTNLLSANKVSEATAVYNEKIKNGDFDNSLEHIIKTTPEPELTEALEHRAVLQISKNNFNFSKCKVVTGSPQEKTLTRAIEKAHSKIKNDIESTLNHINNKGFDDYIKNVDFDDTLISSRVARGFIERYETPDHLKEGLALIAAKCFENTNDSVLYGNFESLLKHNNNEINNIFCKKVIKEIKLGVFDRILEGSITNSFKNTFMISCAEKELHDFINYNSFGPDFNNTNIFKTDNHELMAALHQRYKHVLAIQTEQLSQRRVYWHPRAVDYSKSDLPTFFVHSNNSLPKEFLKLKNESLVKILENQPSVAKFVCFEKELHINDTPELKTLAESYALERINRALKGKSSNKVSSIINDKYFWSIKAPQITEKHEQLIKAQLKRARFLEPDSKLYLKIINEAPTELVNKYNIRAKLAKQEKREILFDKLSTKMEDGSKPITFAFGVIGATIMLASELKHHIRD